MPGGPVSVVGQRQGVGAARIAPMESGWRSGDPTAGNGHNSRRIGADESVPGRPCTDPGLYAADRGLLAYMLQDVRALVRLAQNGVVEVEEYEPIVWFVHGLKRRIVPCRLARLLDGRDLEVVGFFGSRRQAIGASPVASEDPIEALDRDLTAEFKYHPGICSYSTIEMIDGFWANLVLHEVPSDTEDWRSNHVHRGAVALSPDLYRDVRIHNGRLSGGVDSNHEIVLDRTKYWDYGPEVGAEPTWMAWREL